MQLNSNGALNATSHYWDRTRTCSCIFRGRKHAVVKKNEGEAGIGSFLEEAAKKTKRVELSPFSIVILYSHNEGTYLQQNVDCIPRALLEIKALLYGGLLCGIIAADEEESNGRYSDESQDHHPQVSLERIQKLRNHTNIPKSVKSSQS